jgi:hypothetical protein
MAVRLRASATLTRLDQQNRRFAHRARFHPKVMADVSARATSEVVRPAGI